MSLALSLILHITYLIVSHHLISEHGLCKKFASAYS